MLKTMRDSAGSPFIKVLLSILVLSFISFYGFNRARSGCNSDVVARVNGEAIMLEEYISVLRNQLETLRKNPFYKSLGEKELLSYLKDNILQSMIMTRVKEQEAKKLGLKVSNSELADHIKKMEVFFDPETKEFSNDRYKTYLAYFGMTAEKFESDLKDYFLITKLDEFAKNTVKVSEDEVLHKFKVANETVNLSYIAFDPSSFKKSLKYTDKDLKDYYEANRDSFKTEEQRKIELIYLKPEDFIRPTEDELKEYFETEYQKGTTKDAADKTFEKEKEKVRSEYIARYKFDQERFEPVKNDMERILTEIRAQAVKDAKKGLDPYRSRENIVYEERTFTKKDTIVGIPDSMEIVRSAFGLLPGEISNIILGFMSKQAYLIRLKEIKESVQRTFEESKKDVEKAYLEKSAESKAKEEAQRYLQELKKDPSLIKKARSSGYTVVETGEFKQNASGKIPSIGNTRDMMEKAFTLSKQTPVPDEVFPVEKKYYIVALKDRKEADMEKFKAEKENLSKIVLQERQEKFVQEYSNSLLKNAKIKKYPLPKEMF